jgi:putative flippase GtrA
MQAIGRHSDVQTPGAGQPVKMISLRNLRILLRFLIIGVLNTVFSISVYWLLLYSGLTYQWASLLSLILGIIFGFNSHRIAVFKTEGCFFRYVLIWISIYFVNLELIALIRDDIGDYFAGIAVLPLDVVLSFVLMKLFVFRPQKVYDVS